MEPFTDFEALDLLIQVRQGHGAHLLEIEVERICRRILGNPSDEALDKAIVERLKMPHWAGEQRPGPNWDRPAD